ncbi:MAG: SMP-30/gluconolactonase/LRE family protein [Acidobacteria bacterium]|nr:SMP-30/gluconolactonase/LRE family protein [Acidobacteriota bacterium]
MRQWILIPTLTLLAALCLSAQAEPAVTVAFTEGPTKAPNGDIYFTDVMNHRILRFSPDGSLSIFREQSNRANGLLFDPQGRLLACEGAEPSANRQGKSPFSGRPKNPRVTRTDLATGRLEVLADSYQGKPFDSPNDLTMDNKGRIYFTDLPGGAVYRIDPDRRFDRILTTPDIQRPNGISISPDDRTLYLVEANGAQGGARMIRAYDLQADGTVRNMRVFHNFYPGRSADGLCMDTRGNLYAIAGLNALRGTSETLDTKAGVYVFSPEGKQLRFLPIPEDTVTNCAFGGDDMRTLYVTAGKTLYRVRVDVPGTAR